MNGHRGHFLSWLGRVCRVMGLARFAGASPAVTHFRPVGEQRVGPPRSSFGVTYVRRAFASRAEQANRSGAGDSLVAGCP